MSIKLITFDFLGTLGRIRNSISVNYSKVAQKHGVQITEQVNITKKFPIAFKTSMKIDYQNFLSLLLVRGQYPNFGAVHMKESKDWWKSVVSLTFELSGHRLTDSMVIVW